MSGKKILEEELTFFYEATLTSKARTGDFVLVSLFALVNGKK